jgi:hypothetical protein
MALRKEERNLAQETWMRLYKAGNPVPAGDVIAGTMVIMYEKDPLNFEEWENYHPILIVGHNKKSARTAVAIGSSRFNEPGLPLADDALVVPLCPYTKEPANYNLA